jgi:hypothetical protein
MAHLQFVFFDLGGVVCHFVPERRLAAFAAATRLRTEEIRDKLWDSDFCAQCDAGKYSGTDWKGPPWLRKGGREN